jgi:hypothetical protein
MTKWEQWLSQQKNRKDIICAVYDHDGTGRCGKDCLLYPVCKEYSEKDDYFLNFCDKYLDSEAKPTRETVVDNLMIIMSEAEARGLVGDAKMLKRAIELLKENE